LTGMMAFAPAVRSDNFVARSTVLHKNTALDAAKPLPSPVFVWHWYCPLYQLDTVSRLKIRWGNLSRQAVSYARTPKTIHAWTKDINCT
jgi:hypothetical protein